MSNSDDFWQALQTLCQQSEIIIDRPKGTAHPHYGDLIYPLDYGYLKDTTAIDGGGIDVWRGSLPHQMINAIFCTVDLLKRDVEIKILTGCTEAEIQLIERFYNRSDNQKGLLVTKPSSD
jgi:inorganic pyrophosphatase